ASQAAEVEANMATYPELKEYFGQLEETLLRIAQSQAMDTPADLRERIINRFKNINGGGGSGSGSSGSSFFTVAAMILAIAAGLLGWLYYDANTSLNRTNGELTTLQSEMDNTVIECDSV